jgi:soluble lytic murein transglycosylase-like protein
MARLTPKVRAQCERARRPAVMFAIGMALAVPAGSFLLRQDAANKVHPTRVAQAHKSAYSVGYNTTSPHEARKQLTTRLATMFGVPMDLAEQIHAAAEKEGITPRLAFGLFRTESRFKSTAVSPVGAIGLTQVMPKTGAWMRPGTKRSDLFDPGVNLNIGFKYLHELIDQYDGNIRLALTAYNRGPGTVRKVMRRGRNPENGYADMVLKDPSQLKVSTASLVSTQEPVQSKAKAQKTHTKHKLKHSSKHTTPKHKKATKHKRVKVHHKTT